MSNCTNHCGMGYYSNKERTGGEIETFDFYFSQKMKDKKVKDAKYHLKQSYYFEYYPLEYHVAYKHFINHIEFTEVVKKGEKPLSNYDDFKLVHTGSKEYVKNEPINQNTL